MFTQFFGSYLLNRKLVSPEQLSAGLELQKTVRLKLGVLAINAGYMTAEQVEKVHAMQASVDKRIGDIAVDMGFMKVEQVEELLSSQKIGYLLLGQALVDKGYMSNAEFEEALAMYKKENQMMDMTQRMAGNDEIKNIIDKFYHFDVSSDAKVYTEYIALLLRNIVRFIGDDFTPMGASVIQNYQFDWLATQEIIGDFNAYIGIEANEKAFIEFASRYAGEQFTENDDYVKASVGEFLNLQDGLFSVNLSNEHEIELDLKPQEIHHQQTLRELDDAYLIPICFPFGTINIIIGHNVPVIG